MSKMSNVLAALGVVAALGVAALPLSTYADENTDSTPISKDATVKLTVKKKLSLTLDATEADLDDGSANPAIVATVITNHTDGYTLKIAGSTTESDDKTVLTSGVVADDIAAFSGTAVAPATLELADGATASVWGYTVTGDDIVTGFQGKGVGKYAGVTADGEAIASSTSATAAAGNVTTVTFGAKLIDNQAAGTYTGQVTFTASDNIK